jgi:ketosteroid isomerase-like protein
MSSANVELVRQLFEVYRAGDPEPFVPADPDFELVRSAKMPDGGGSFCGSAARASLTAWLDAFEEHEAMPVEFIEAGDKVVVTVLERGRPRGGTRMVQGTWMWVYTVRDGQVRRLEIYADRAEALGAVGLGD